mgnify:CR=1 FL=1
MLQVEAEISEIRERIRDEVSRIAVSLENEAEFARTRVASLQTSLREAQGHTSEQNKEAIQLRALQREAAANRALYETFLNRFKETSTTQGMETSDARVVSYAEVPGGPSFPNRKKMLTQYVVVGFIGACGLVLLIALLNPCMTSPEQVQRTVGEYVIGLIPIGAGKSPPHEYVLERPNSGLVEAIKAITGWETSLFEILRVSERSNVMARVFNNREGFSPADDRVIRRWHEPMPDGPLKGQRIDPEEFQAAIEMYYEISGWDKDGKPTPGKLIDLNLESL